jgi:hypothetical protein
MVIVIFLGKGDRYFKDAEQCETIETGLAHMGSPNSHIMDRRIGFPISVIPI